MRFFYCRNVIIKKNGEKVKVFQFKLKDGLVKALGNVNRTTLHDEIHVDITNIIKGSKKVEIMEKEKLFNSFYDYLIEKEYLFDKETIENYLLSLKVKPFAILTGNSGTGKTKLSQLFAKYISANTIDKEHINNNRNKFTASVKVGKSAINRGWAIPREDSINLIPKMKCEEPFPVLIDGVPAKGKINFNVRFFYETGDAIVSHLNELAEKDPNQRITLELDAPNEDDYFSLDKFSKSLNEESNEYLTFKTDNFHLNNDWFGLGKKTVCSLLGLDKYEGIVDAYFDDIKSSEDIYISTRTGTRDEKLINYLKSASDLSEIDIKISKKDLYDTFLNEESKGKKNVLSFERKIGKYYDWVIPKNDLNNFLPVKNKYTWDAVIEGIETKLEFWIHDVLILASSSENEELTGYLNQKNSDDIINISIDLSTFRDNGVSSDLCLEFEDNSLNQENYKIIPVGANWTENRNIVGYHNVISGKYTSTPAYEIIQLANNNRKDPYFLILDEMNLSHVERYFADFLSAIESGEKIPLYGAEDLEIPPNLFIIGTVNVDETTYMFSPKVLDRANVLEFKTHSAESYMNGDIEIEAPDGDLLFLENPLVGSDIRDFGIAELRQFFDGVTADGEDFWNVLSSEIDKFQSILAKSGFDFGFRVINEIVRFMVVAWEYEGSPEEFDNWNRYFDAQIKQKMLPKLHGSEKVIGETLDLLFKACLLDEDSIVLTKETAKYYTSAKKLEEMRKVLRKQRYVSFIN